MTRLVLTVIVIYILLWQFKMMRNEKFSDIGEKINQVTETFASTFSKSFDQILKLKKDIVLKLTGTGKLHVKVR